MRRFFTRCEQTIGAARRAAACLLCGVVACTTPAAFAAGPDMEARLLGAWACESGNCPDEEISFAVTDGVHTYDSWLHQRPSAVNGTWQVAKGTLSITCCAGLSYAYDIVEVTDAQLVLREAGTAETVVMSRIRVRE